MRKPPRTHRKAWVLAIALSLSATTTLAGCGATSPPPPTAKAGGTVVVGLPVDPDTLVPWKALKINAVKVVGVLYSTLTQYDADMKVQPGLAESWDISPNGLEVTFNLRDGVTFSDGSELNSEDVKYTLELIQNPDSTAVSSADLVNVDSIETPDALTVVMHLNAPNAGLPTNLANPTMSIVPDGATEESLASEPAGSGPFVLASRVVGESLTLVRNDNYWVPDEPKLDGIEFRVIPDQASLASALQSGSIDIVAFDDPIIAHTVESSRVSLQQTPEQHYHAIILNSDSAAFSNVNARLALQCAIDRQEIIDTVVSGDGEPTGPINTQPYLSDPNLQPCPARDLGKAAAYLDEAGVSNGFSFDMVVSSDLYATGVNIAQNIQAQLAEANITVNLRILESGAYVASWKDPATRDSVLVLAGGNSPDPDSLYGSYFGVNGPRAAVAGYSTPELQDLFTEGKSTADGPERKAIYDEISSHLVDNAVWIWLFTGYNFTGVTQRVLGFVPTPTGSFAALARVPATH